MRTDRQFYINGSWVDPLQPTAYSVITPATETVAATISLGGVADVDRAVEAARAAFPAYSQTTVAERIDLFHHIIIEYKKRYEAIANSITLEMGAPRQLAFEAHAASGLAHFSQQLEVLKDYAFERDGGGYLLRHEAIGVCGLISPWNWPINQVVCKVAPALAAGCTMVLKPSEIAPLDAMILADVLDAAGVPAGVFNLVNGDGTTVGARLSSHPNIAMVSFTGSTTAGIAVAQSAASTVKRVSQELGGKSANIILDDADIETAVTQGVNAVLSNSGQTCTAPTRMFVPRAHYTQALKVAQRTAEAAVVGDPQNDNTDLGPVVSQAHSEKVQAYIQLGIDEGASLLTGGTGRPDHCPTGYFVKPTIFADVTPAMRIAREEIFGPVLCMTPYSSETEAILQANDSDYGLAAYVQSGSESRALAVAKQLRAGICCINDAPYVAGAPFGGYKHSGNGREAGRYGLEEFLEVKAVFAHSLAGER